ETEVLTATEFVLPNLTAVITGVGNGRVTDARDLDGYSVLWHVPIDDTHHWKYDFDFRRSGPIQGVRRTEMVNYQAIRNLSNRYQQDRKEMVNDTYSGFGRDFTVHDKWATEGEAPIQDRTTEHLGAPDRAIATARELLLKAIRDLQEGKEPANVIRDPDLNDLPLAPWVMHAPKGTDWEAYCGYVEGLARSDGYWNSHS
ncbi:MAG TPA: hypothetical protein VGK54_14825, partial [Chloroflexota bacterium]